MKKDTKPVIEKQTKDPEEIKEFMRVLESMAKRILLPNNIIKNVDINQDGKIDGYQFNISNPFYTAESLSSVKEIIATVDGEKINPEKINLIARGQGMRLKDVTTMHEVWWGFGEVISVYIEKTGGLKKGNHELDTILRMRTTISYGFPRVKKL
jgi:2-iminoacetate synthase ThiH